MMTRSQKKAFVGRPGPAVRVEEPEERPATDRATSGQRLRHRYSTVNVPVIDGIGWTWQMNL